jgi:alkylresorcinol/alkylpyrone synthase
VPRLASVGTSVPAHQVSQDQARSFAQRFFGRRFSDIEKRLELFEHTQIEKRHICVPVEWFDEPRSFVEKNATYIHEAQRLGEDAIHACLDGTGFTPQDIDYLVFVSTTGLATPSIDARLIGRMGMRPDTRRTPIWGLGCAGGVAGLAHAYHHALGHPNSRTLVLAVELCSLTFHFGDQSKSNLVATALFGDGAAAVLVTGDEVDANGAEIVDSRSTLFPDSLDVMGWNFESEGMQVVFSRAIPGIVLREAEQNIGDFLASHDLSIRDVEHLITHPGGVKVMEAYEQALSLTNGKLDTAREILRDYGNMSSASVLFVLERYLQTRSPGAGSWGLMTALGPGFSSEQVLLRF